MGSGVWSGCACYSAGCTPEATWLSTMAALGGSPSTIVDGGRSSITIENGGCIGKKVPEASYAPNTRKRHSSPSHVLQPSRVQSHPLSLGGGGDLHALLLAVGRRAVDLLARLADLLEDGLVGQVGDDLCGLVLEGDFVRVDACGWGGYTSAVWTPPYVDRLVAVLLAWRGERRGRELLKHTVQLLEHAVDGTGAAA